MELRRLQRRLHQYSPPIHATRYYLNGTKHAGRSQRDAQTAQDETPWFAAQEDIDRDDPLMKTGSTALIKLRTHAEDLAALQTPKGLLLTGPPGSGKSFLVDLWYATMPTPYKMRRHYNQFVLELYRGVWEESQRRSRQVHRTNGSTQEVAWNKSVRDLWRNLYNKGLSPSRWRGHPSLASYAHSEPSIAYAIARRLVVRHWLLVFDEVQLLDVSSAGLLADVLSWYWRMGGIVVGTSNKVPDDLYRNGVQRERLEPFVEALKVRCPVLAMTGGTDWRRERAAEHLESTWFTSDDVKAFDAYVRSIGAQANAEPSTAVINVFGRQVVIPWACSGVCMFSWHELCEESLGHADYLSIASIYRTVIIDDIPILTLQAKNQGRRFISLIDSLYESRCRLVCVADAAPENIFFPDDAETDSSMTNKELMMAETVSEMGESFRPNISSYENLPERPTVSSQSLESLSIFSGEEERFAYKRAVSRLVEMTSRKYAESEEWTPLAKDARKWETSRELASPMTPNRSANLDPSDASFTRDDFAVEAAYEGSLSPRAVGRPPPPRLKEHHVWGVRDDWGERAGDWGKGAAVHSAKDPKTPP